MNEHKREYWSKLIAEQEASGQTIRAFCKARGIGDQSFYLWRKQLHKSEPVQFAVLRPVDSAAPLELMLPGDEQLRIGKGVGDAPPGAGRIAAVIHLPPACACTCA